MSKTPKKISKLNLMSIAIFETKFTTNSEPGVPQGYDVLALALDTNWSGPTGEGKVYQGRWKEKPFRKTNPS